VDSIFQGVNLLCSAFVFALTILAVINFRKPRPFKPAILLVSIILTGLMLVIYIPLSGIRLNFFIGAAFFFLGMILGGVSGFSVKLGRGENGVIGRTSRLGFLLWGFSLVFSMLMNLLPSTLASTLGALPFCLTSGMQLSSNVIVLFRTLALIRQKPLAA